MLITGGKIYTMESGIIDNGYISIDGGKIIAVGDGSDCPRNSDVIDVSGKIVMPGFIDPHCHIGMWGDSIGIESADGNEDTDPITPHLRAIDSINPLDRYFGDALRHGITAVVTGPGSSNAIAGQFAAMSTYGKKADDMVIKLNAGTKFSLGENPKSTYDEKGQPPVTRMAIAALIREQLFKAQKYMDEKEPEFDMKCESLIPLLKRETKAFFHAHRADDIFTALRISREFDLDPVLIHATEGHLVADELAELAVISGPLVCDRCKPELAGQSLLCPSVLANSGATVACCTDHPELPIQFLWLECKLLTENGFSFYDALKTITITAAEVCGIADTVGSIAAGKRADIVVWSENELSKIMPSPDIVIVGGKISS
ncbi:MAG: amidohydrolase family protein [Oscillospiraceae bacterium]|nr:amidohydrolase family protein [Oscillospiraceae bacterium]